MNFETPDGIAIERDVLGSFTVARLTRNPELRDPRVPPVAFNKTRLALCNMAVHARTVPCPDRIIFLQVRRHQECLTDWGPHFFGDDVSEGKLLERAPLAGLEPGDLQRVRTGHEHDLLPVTVAGAFPSLVHKERVAAAFDFVFPPIQCELELIHVLRQTGRRCHLGHRAVIRRMPGRVISGMTRAARVRADITGDLRFDGAVLRRLRFAWEIMKRNQNQNACACDRRDSEQTIPPGSRQS